MKLTAEILTLWRHQYPERLLQAALRQAQKLVELSSLCEELRTQNLSLSEQLEAKTKRIAELEAALQAAERAAHRQAAPFRIPEHKRRAQPKPPGRKAGHPGAFRQLPDQIDQFIEAQLCACPHCGRSRFRVQGDAL